MVPIGSGSTPHPKGPQLFPIGVVGDLVVGVPLARNTREKSVEQLLEPAAVVLLQQPLQADAVRGLLFAVLHQMAEMQGVSEHLLAAALGCRDEKQLVQLLSARRDGQAPPSQSRTESWKSWKRAGRWCVSLVQRIEC